MLKMELDICQAKRGVLFMAKILYDNEMECCVQDYVSVVPWEFLEGRIAMELPCGFAEMEEERKASYYPYEKRPDIILENMDEDVRITLQLLEREQGSGDIYDVVYDVSRLIGKAFPEYKQSNLHLSEKGYMPIAWFLLFMEDLHAEHMKAVALPEGGGMLLLTVTYPEEKSVKWRQLCKYLLESVQADMVFTKEQKK